MKRREAILKELNLYPLWRLREGSGEAAGSPAVAPVQAAAKPEAAAQKMPADPVAAQAEITAAPQTDEQVARREELIAALPWPELKAVVRDCTACGLRAGCTQTVLGVGDEKARWLFVGEGPGADEDIQGEPFVGQAGKLLDAMLLSIKLKRGRDVYIANIVKCRPPNNRTPEADEIATCLPYLKRQIALIKPEIIVALGKTAATSLLGREATLGSLRGQVHQFQGIPLIVTYHPAYLLRTPLDKAKAWEDLCLAVETVKG
jgi:uracil-DNA glycosylase family 4